MSLVREVTLYVRRGECTTEQVMEHFGVDETIISIRNALYAARKKGWIEIASKKKIRGQDQPTVTYRFIKMDEAEAITRIAILNRTALELAWSKMTKGMK